MDETTAFREFKERCAVEGFLQSDPSANGDDLQSGICDDGTLLRFLRARNFDVEKALQQYKTTTAWRDQNQLIELYDSIDVSQYEQTRNLYTHWIGRTARNGSPVCLFEIKQLTPDVMTAYNKSCASTKRQWKSTESEAMLRLFCTYENLIRFILPLCSIVQSRPQPNSPVTDTTCIVDISGVSFLQLWRLRSHMQAASTLATSHYPETLGRTYIIGAPSYFPTVWGWISTWFDQHTVSKIRIIPYGKELSMLSESIDPTNIPQQYGGELNFTFGMPPILATSIVESVKWLNNAEGEHFQQLPQGPVRWINDENSGRVAIAVGTVNGIQRKTEVLTTRE